MQHINELKEIANQKTVIKNHHESLVRSYQLLDYVMDMVERGDSVKTIRDLVEFMRSLPESEEED